MPAARGPADAYRERAVVRYLGGRLTERGTAVQVVAGVGEAHLPEGSGHVVERGRLVVAADPAVLVREVAEVVLVVPRVAPVVRDGQPRGVPAPLVLDLLLHGDV